MEKSSKRTFCVTLPLSDDVERENIERHLSDAGITITKTLRFWHGKRRIVLRLFFTGDKDLGDYYRLLSE